jgi:hypothetical protein
MLGLLKSVESSSGGGYSGIPCPKVLLNLLRKSMLGRYSMQSSNLHIRLYGPEDWNAIAVVHDRSRLDELRVFSGHRRISLPGGHRRAGEFI